MSAHVESSGGGGGGGEIPVLQEWASVFGDFFTLIIGTLTMAVTAMVTAGEVIVPA